jgi:hypothetical protein
MMNNKSKLPMSEKETQTLRIEGETDPKDTFLAARRFATLEKSKLKKVKPRK